MSQRVVLRPIGARRSVRAVAAAAVVGLGATAIVAAGGGTAAAADLPQAQSVGNFVDATVGGQVLDPIAKLQYARATAPGSNGVQNPLDVTALDAINLPLTGALQLPQIAGITLGAANQVAKANIDGSSYGASGAVSNSGGVSVGGDNNAAPSAATIDISASSLAGNSPVTLPGGTSGLDALGSIKATIGAVAGKASTPKGYGKDGSTEYGIAGVDLTLASPLLGGLLKQVAAGATTLNGLLQPIISLLTPLGALPANCTLVSGILPTTINLPDDTNKVVSIDPSNGSIALSVGALLKSLNLDLNNLPPNTDLVKYIVDNLGKIITQGVGGLVNGIITQVGKLVGSCTPSGALATGLQQLLTALTGGVTQLTTALGTGLTQVTGALGPVLDNLNQLIGIGVNVQPNGPKGTYTDPLDATPKQGTPVVADQTIVRAIEVNLAGGVSSQVGSGNTGILSLALGNAAAGPSNAPNDEPTPTDTVPPTVVPSTNVPTGIPAGQAGGDQNGGSPLLPLVAILTLLAVSGGAFWQLRLRGGNHQA